MKAIKVIVADDGTTEITTTGFKGKGCLEATAALEKALGKVKKDTRTPEYFQQETNTTRQKV